MTFKQLQKSLAAPAPPDGIPPALLALWHDAKGNWEKAHEIAQEGSSPDTAWVHAYLHRKEGDPSNAQYWYHRANKDTSRLTFDEEWMEIARTLTKT